MDNASIRSAARARFSRAAAAVLFASLFAACAVEEGPVISTEFDLSTAPTSDTGELWVFATVDGATVEIEVPDETSISGFSWKPAGQIPPATYFDSTTGAPVDAEAVVDQRAAGRDIEQQPTALKLTVDQGVYKVRVSAEGYAPVEREVYAGRAVKTRKVFHLSYGSGGLQVDTDPPGFSVYLDAKLIGTTPLYVDNAPVGDRLLQIDRAGFHTYSQQIKIEAGDVKIVRRTYSVGRISLTSEPSGATVVDAANLIVGTTPCVVIAEAVDQTLRFQQTGWEDDLIPVLAIPEDLSELTEGSEGWNTVGPEREYAAVLSQFGLVKVGGSWIGKREVTNREWTAFVEWTIENGVPNEAAIPFVWTHSTNFDLDNPVAGVSWNDAQAYCQWLASQTGMAYRLPTLAEWRQAAAPRIGKTYPWGDVFNVHCANAGPNSDNELAPADSYYMGRSAAGCLNMSGNVAEWTQDKSVVGGSYHSPLKECTIDSVEQVRPESRDYRVGFRIARN